MTDNVLDKFETLLEEGNLDQKALGEVLAVYFKRRVSNLHRNYSNPTGGMMNRVKRYERAIEAAEKLMQ